jgi:hypothetical protein
MVRLLALLRNIGKFDNVTFSDFGRLKLGAIHSLRRPATPTWRKRRRGLRSIRTARTPSRRIGFRTANLSVHTAILIGGEMAEIGPRFARGVLSAMLAAIRRAANCTKFP